MLDSWSDVIQRTLNDAHTLRAEVERSLGAGEGDEDHPTLKRLRGVVGVLGAAWGYATPFPTPDRSDAVSGNDSEPHALTAARAVSAVLEQADDRGRLALLARVDAVRQEYGWSEASPLAQRVIDQYALAVVHDETVRVCCKALDKGNSVTTSTTVLLKEVIATLAEAGGAAPQQPLDDAGAAGGRAWARRRASAERGLRRATRLLRHAQKAGWLPPENPGDAHHQEVGENGQQSHPARSLADPFAPLAAPKPALRRPPLRGRAAEAAAETRAYIDALRAAWPPPTRIREEELLAPDCLWSPFDYVVECDDAGCLIGEGTWLVRVRMPASPDELLAALAEWAPEYAD